MGQKGKDSKKGDNKKKRRDGGSRWKEDDTEEDDDAEGDLFLSMTAPTNSNVVPRRHLQGGAANGHRRHRGLPSYSEEYSSDEEEHGADGRNTGGSEDEDAPLATKGRSPRRAMDCHDVTLNTNDFNDRDNSDDRFGMSSSNDGNGDVYGEEDEAVMKDHASFRLADVIEATLRESRRLASAAQLHRWADFVQSSLADWRTHISRRELCQRRLREAERRREHELKEKQRQEMQNTKIDMMERIRLLKERALADVARSEANVRLWKSSTVELESRASPVEDTKNVKLHSGESKTAKGEKANQACKDDEQSTREKDSSSCSGSKHRRKGSSSMLPKIKLSFSWDKAAAKERDKDKAREQEKDVDEGLLHENSSIKEFVTMEEEEEARLNKSVKKKRPTSPRLSHALSLLGIGSPPSRGRTTESQQSKPVPGNVSPPLSPRVVQIKSTSTRDRVESRTAVVRLDEESVAQQALAQERKMTSQPAALSASEEPKEGNTRPRERSKTFGSLLSAKRSDKNASSKVNPSPGVLVKRSASGSLSRSTASPAKGVRLQPPKLKELPISNDGEAKSPSARRPSPRPATMPSTTTTPRPQSRQESSSVREKRLSSTASNRTSAVPPEDTSSSTSGRRRFLSQPRLPDSQSTARARTPSPPRTGASIAVSKTTRPSARAPSPTCLVSSKGASQRASSPVLVPMRQRSASACATPAVVKPGTPSVNKSATTPSPIKPTPIRPTPPKTDRTSSTQPTSSQTQTTSSTQQPGGRRLSLVGRSASLPARTRSPSPPAPSTTSTPLSPSSTPSSSTKPTTRPGSGRTSPMAAPADGPSSSGSTSSSSSPTSASPLSSSPSKSSRFLSVLTKSSSSRTVKKAASLGRSPTAAEKNSAEAHGSDVEPGASGYLTRSKSHRDIVRDRERERSGSRKEKASRDGATL